MKEEEFYDSQISLWDLLGSEEMECQQEETKPVAKEKKKKKASPVKKEKVAKKPVTEKRVLPEILEKASECKLFHDFLALFGYTGITMIYDYHGDWLYYNVDQRDIFTGSKDGSYLNLGNMRNCGGETGTIYADEKGNTWYATIKFVFDTEPGIIETRNGYGNYNYSTKKAERTAILSNFTISKWRLINRIPERYFFLQKQEQLDAILKNVNPYGYTFAMENCVKSGLLLLVPFVEILSKAGFAFVDKVMNDSCYPSDIECFNRLCGPGKNPKEILKTSKVVFNTLKNERSLKIWDSYRKMDKFGRITPDAVQRCYAAGYNEKDLAFVAEILGRTWQGKQILNWSQLVAYLERLDVYEAIEKEEALTLIRDYLSLCNILKMQPRLDGDSLKREHDVAARLVREVRREEEAKKMEKGCEKMAVFDYSEQIYFVRAIRNYDDLIDEARQQHNCLACYSGYIASGTSYIYVLRETRFPDRSLVSIELEPKTLQIRQKYMASNQPIRNKSISDFIDRWHKVVKERAASSGMNTEIDETAA